MLENPKINIKLKLSALWSSLMFLFIYGDYFELYVPDKIEKLRTVTEILDSPTKLFIASVMLAIPALMISLTIMLKPKISKWLNIGVASFFILVVAAVGSSSFYTWYSFYVLYAILEVIVFIFIVKNALKWPKIANVKV